MNFRDLSIRNKLFISILFILILSSCFTVPITGRHQLRLIPNDTLLSTSFENYEKFLQENTLSNDSQETHLVQTVGLRIQHAVEKYMVDQGMSELLNGYKWEFNLIDKDEMNAFCMPGGKVIVYSKILETTRNEGGLAVVMGHEIAHAVAQHGNERMSQIPLTQMGGKALSTALANRPEETQRLWMDAFGMGANIGVLLPFSRVHESEADRLGLIFMAIAGYNPYDAVRFWTRMAQINQNDAPEEFLSTHPSDERRVKEIEKLIPSVMDYYEMSRQATLIA